MKAMPSLFLAASVLVGGVVHAATISAKPLQCGGYVSVDTNGAKTILTVKKTADSNCKIIEVESEGIRNSIPGPSAQFVLKNLGRQIAVIVNNEVVILDTVTPNSAPTSYSDSVQAQRLQIEKQRESRERAKANADAAADSVDAAIAVGEIGSDVVNSSER